jgi:transposase
VQPDWRDERIAELEAELSKRDARIAELERQVEALTRQVAELLGQQAQNSSNSQRPLSSDSPEQRRQRRDKNKKKKSQAARKRGGQPGHQGAHRELVSTEKVSKFVDLFPSECENCWKPCREWPTLQRSGISSLRCRRSSRTLRSGADMQ